MQANQTRKGLSRTQGARKSGRPSCGDRGRRRALRILASVLAIGFCGAFPLCPAYSYYGHSAGDTASDAAVFRTAPDRVPFLLTDPSGDWFQSFLGRAKTAFPGLSIPALHPPAPLSARDSFQAALLGNRAIALFLFGTFSPRGPPLEN
jgi:hypothetical protein